MNANAFPLHGVRSRRLAVASVIACALAGSAALGLLSPPSAGAARVLCSPGGGRTLSRSPRVRVFVRRGTFYSCWLPTRRRTALGRVGAEMPDGGAVLASRVRIDGEFVVFSQQADGDPGYDVAEIVSVNARTGRRRRTVSPLEEEEGFFSSSVVDVGVADDDAIVYVQADGSPCPGRHAAGEHGPDDAVIAVEPGAKPRTLECEAPSEPEHSISQLAVVGKTASWMHSGVLHSVTLR